ncbi:hypothetical protein HYW31_02255 [Candidatus Berkelbacteria bacterium]|nr:hypothetical protein [Candidatus Berkelbacteria bacterium]
MTLLPSLRDRAYDLKWDDFIEILGSVINFAAFLGAGIALLFFIWGAIQYILAAGVEEKTETAKKTMLYALIGLVVMLAAYVIVGYVFREAGVANPPTPSPSP